MLFNSTAFFIFFACVYATYLACRGNLRVQNILLVVASYIFYGWWDWRFLGLIWLSTLVDFICSNQIVKQPRLAKRFMMISVFANLGILGFFKYFNFFSDTLSSLLQGLGFSVAPFTLEIILPIGISFYTFQTLGYTIDVYRGNVRPVKNLLNFALYVAFFPQLVAGPIERAARLIKQIREKRVITFQRIEDGAWLILIGLFKKVVVADNLAPMVSAAFDPSQPLDATVALLSVYAFAFQIYCDFSGYTDIARGVAKFFGFELILNFRRPFFSGDPRDFWLRWHISLSQWLRNYLFLSLGGNRGGAFGVGRNLFLTMLLGGLWHGATWMFVAFGAFHGALLVGHRIWDRATEVGKATLGAVPNRLWNVFATIAFFHITCFGFLIFRASTPEEFSHVLSAFIEGNFSFGGPEVDALSRFVFFCLPVFFFDVVDELFERRTRQPNRVAMSAAPVPLRSLAVALLLFLLAIAGAPDGQEFIYFQF
jgi:alginate O-acetyltransferase complex protein AlgI